MKIELIKTGGLLGKTQKAEHEIPDNEVSKFRDLLNNLNKSTVTKNKNLRDDFKYFLRFDGKETEIDINNPNRNFKQIFNTLEKNLKY